MADGGPGEVVVICQGEEHRIRVDGQDVVMENHDLRGEIAGLALAGRAVEPPLCVQVYLLLSTVSLMLSEGGSLAQRREAYCQRGVAITGRVIGLDCGWTPSERMWDMVVPLLKGEPWGVTIWLE